MPGGRMRNWNGGIFMNMMEWIAASCILLALISVIRQIFKEKLPANIRYGIWLIVLVRLLVPVSLTGSDISVLNLFSNDLQNIQTQNDKQMMSPSGAFYGDNMQTKGTGGSQNQTANVSDTNPGSVEPGTANAADSIWRTALTGIWITGMAVCGLALAGSNLTFMRKLRRSRQLIPPQEIRTLEYGSAMAEHISVYTSKLVSTPCLFGLFRPAIYIRPEDRYNTADLPYILNP